MFRATFSFLCLASLLALALPKAHAQVENVNNGTSTPIAGAGHDYIGMVNETVNPANGSVSIRVGAPVPPGRRVTLPFAFAYDSNGVMHLTGSPSNWHWRDNTAILGKAGWGYSVPALTVSIVSSVFQMPSLPSQSWVCDYTTDYVFQDESGGRHALNLSVEGNQPGYSTDSCGMTGPGIQYTSASDGPIYGTTTAISGSFTQIPAVTVTDADGTAVHFPAFGNPPTKGTSVSWSRLPGWIKDRNGNTVNLPGTTCGGSGCGLSFAVSVTDTGGRTAISTSGFGNDGDTVSISGLGAAYTVHWAPRNMTGYVLRASVMPGYDVVACTPFGVGSNVAPAVSSIVLPNSQRYSFSYDGTYGLLSRITYPTGGYIQYYWTINPTSEPYTSSDSTGAECSFKLDSVALGERDVSFNGSTIALRQTFSYSPTVWDSGSVTAKWLSKQTIVTTQDLTRPGSPSFRTEYNYTYMLVSPPIADADSNANEIPLESSIRYFDWNGSLLRTVTKVWNNPRQLARTATQLDNNATSEIDYTYTGADQVTEKDEYDYGSGARGPLVRKTLISYAPFPGTGIVNRPSSIVTYDSSGTNRMGETDYVYDGVPVSATSNVTGHDYTNYSSSFNTRGNATQKKQWLNTTNTFFLWNYTYDDTGQLLTAQDPKGNPPTSYSYTDSFTSGMPPGPTNAYLTQITYPNTALAHFERFSYGYADGQLRTYIDQNSQTTSYLYGDSLARLTETDYPDGGKTLLSYSDAGPSPSVTASKLLGAPSTYVTSVRVMDGVGNPVESKLITDPEGTDFTDTTYDGPGRVWKVSNRYRSTSDASYGITTYSYDALGRVSKITRPDSSVLQTSYAGRAISVTDEGNGSVSVQRVSQTDALGRLTSVCEVSSAAVIGAVPAACGQDISASGFLTTYQYDALNNLTQVSQGAETRTFAYNSLSRLTSATNPESGSTSYTYDANGNVLTKQDARGVTTCFGNWTGSACDTTGVFGYDALNRPAQKTYSDGSPRVSFYYDESSVALGSWTSPALANPIGRITHATTVNSGGALLTARVKSYDRMGRPADLWQCAPSTCGVASYGVDYTYDLVGNQKTLATSGKTFTSTYNAADHLTGLASSLVDAQHPGTLLGTVSYAPVGSAKATLGNNVTEARTYNKRAWLSTLTDTVPLAGAPATGWLTITGTEKSQPILASPATGSVTISGSERSKVIDPCPGGGCPKTIWDAGTVSITVNGFTKSTSYGQTSTSSTIASSLASAFNADSASPVTASVSGSTVSLTTKQTGANVNYPLSASSATTNTPNFTGTSFPVSTSGSRLTGGHDASTLWDAGTVALTVNGAPKSVTYGQSSTANSLAESLTTAVNGDTSYPVTATLSGATLSLTTRADGSLADYSLSASVATNYPSSFSPPSFATSTSGSTLTGGGTTNSIGLTYAGDGDILSGSDTVNGNWSYGYDALNRLISAGKSGLSFTYDYDRYGNRWHQNVTSGSGPAPQLGFTGGNNRIDGYSYDAAGNLLNDGLHRYRYDAEGRIACVDPDATTWQCTTNSTNYIYDAEGRRVAKAVGSSITEEYVYDLAGHVISQYAPYTSNTWVRDEIYASDWHVATYRNGTTYFNHGDWLGTERARSDMTGAMCETVTSLPFGDGQATSGSCGDPSPMHFTGKERDTESGNDYFPARFNSNSLGRWLSPDPAGRKAVHIGDPQTWNMYAYSRDNPITLVDPSGALWHFAGGHGPSWVDTCPKGDTCYGSVAVVQGNDLAIYGSHDAQDISTIQANENGNVDLNAVAEQDDANFEVKGGAASYLSLEKAADFFNTTEQYSEARPWAAPLVATEAGNSEGSAVPPHQTHDLARSVDVRYQDEAGFNLQGNDSYAKASESGMRQLVDIARRNGFNQNYSAKPKEFGTEYAPQHENHLHLGTTRPPQD